MLGTASFRTSAILTPGITLLLALVLIIGKAAGGIGTIAYVSNRDGNLNIYMLDLDTGRSRQLTHSRAEEFAPAFAPDGRFMAFVSDQNGPTSVYTMASSGLDQRRVPLIGIGMDAQGGLTQAEVAMPALSPDGRWLAYMSTTQGNRDIYVVTTACLDNPQECQPHRLTVSPTRDQHPLWSPDGRWLAFESNADGGLDLYLMDTACLAQPATCATQIHNLTATGYNQQGAAWSPDATRLMFVSATRSATGQNADIALLPFACTAIASITPDDTGASACAHPAWSPDGRHIVYEVWQEGIRDLYVVAADCATPGGDCQHPPRRLTQYLGDNHSAAFLP